MPGWPLGSPRDDQGAPRPPLFNVLFFCRIRSFLEVIASENPDSAQKADLIVSSVLGVVTRGMVCVFFEQRQMTSLKNENDGGNAEY